jgi:pimeloyl-ACP methyl ester carboxylesterase
MACQDGEIQAPWVAVVHAVREICCYVMTQLPLFQWMGQARGATVGPPIIYAHGYGQTCGSFWAMARAMARQGRGPMFAYDYSSLDDIGHSAEGLGRFIQAVRRSTGAPRVDVIGHSMGSLVIFEHLRRAGDAHDVRRCVTLASPHCGIRWSGPLPGRAASQLRRGSLYLRELAAARLPVPVLNVSSEYDYVVHPTKGLSAWGGRSVSIKGAGHIALLFSERMFQETAAFLGEGDGAPVLPAPASSAHPLTDFNALLGSGALDPGENARAELEAGAARSLLLDHDVASDVA